MCLAQIAVLDALVANLDCDRLRVGRVKGRRRQRRGGTGRVSAILPIDVVLRAHPQPRIFVRDDLRAILTQNFVRAGVREVPVRIEQQRDGHRAEHRAHEVHERCRVLGRAAVDHGGAAAKGQQQDVAAGADDLLYAASQRHRGDRVAGWRLRCGRAGERVEAEPHNRCGGRAERRLEKLSTCSIQSHENSCLPCRQRPFRTPG